MGFAIGTRIGPYEVVSPLGEGGMGVVFRARDTKLGRDVAIKALPDGFAAHADRISRFQREAHVLASLNHPNIAHVYGLEESGRSQCIVMELVEGETLARRLVHGALPVEQALSVAGQIADALAAAHEKGVVHRDLKPGNVMLTADGRVKVLDFGLAKAIEDEQRVELSNSPTVFGATQDGVILGTAAYMSPEQAKGQRTDPRSDIWAFGCVLFEMLTGTPAFPGKTTVDILAGIMKADPDWSALPDDTPSSIRVLLRRCLQKDQTRRLHHIVDARLEIDDARREPDTPPPAGGASRRSERRAWLAGVGVLSAALLFVSLTPRSSADRGAGRIEFGFDTRQSLNSQTYSPGLAVSPDGSYVAYVGTTADNRQALWVRALNSKEPRELPGTEGANLPFWSPDGRFIGFFSQGKLKKVDVEGGSPQTICEALTTDDLVPGGGAWSSDGVILFAPSGRDSLIYRVASGGGTPSPITALNQSRKESTHHYPSFLPDGRHFIYTASVTSQVFSGVYVGSLDSTDVRRIGDAYSNVMYANPGYLLFVRDGLLLAQLFDSNRLELTGDAIQIGVDVQRSDQGFSPFSISNNGVIAYRTGRGLESQLVWRDRSGAELGVLGNPGRYSFPALSPDGKRVAVGINDPRTGTDDIWLFDVARNVPSRFTSQPLREFLPIWSPDGTEILFGSSAKGPEDIYKKLASNAGPEEVVLESLVAHKHPTDWSHDGRFIVFEAIDSKTGGDVFVLDLRGDRRPPTPYLQSTFNESGGQLSPDGHWMAYSSDKSGRREIYIQSFPTPGDERLISTEGGTQPRWRGDGREIFFVDRVRRLMSVELSPTLEPSPPKKLFDTRVPDVGVYHRYSPTSDGQRFLVESAAQTDASPITVVVNWTARAEH